MVEIVCVNAGDKFPDLYVQRLYNMLGRKFSLPFRLTCFTDRHRDISKDIVQVDIKEHAAKGPFNKVLLYNPDVMPYDEALFMDITLVIKEELSGYVDYAKSLKKDLVAIRDWRRPVMNSCFQWIAKNDTLKAVWDVYDSDQFPEFRTKGDQFFTYSTLQALGLEHKLGYFPDGEIQSYKVLREAHRESEQKFQELWAKTKVIKFHGSPRQHEVINPLQQFWVTTVHYPQYAFKDWSFLVKEIKAWWR